jgi:hypothetical protein
MSKSYTFQTADEKTAFVAVYNQAIDGNDLNSLPINTGALSVSAPKTDVADAIAARDYIAEYAAMRLDALADDIRSTRNALLNETDWMALIDTGLPDDWRSYRQALRDVTEQAGFPEAVIWPSKPATYAPAALSVSVTA